MNKKMDNLKILRVLACIGVLSVHLGQRMELTGVIGKISDFGQYGVYLFFLISGFLIANSYEKYGKDNLFKFILKKELRLLPLYYAVVTWFYITDKFIFRFYVVDETGFGWKRYFLFLNGFIQPGQDSYGYWSNLGASWTIPCFALAYIIIPIYLSLIQKLKKKLGGGGHYFVHLIFSLLLTLVYWYRIPIIINFTHHYFDSCFQLCFFFWGITLFYGIKEYKENILIVFCSVALIFIHILGVIEYPLVYSLIFSIIVISTSEITISNSKIRIAIEKVDEYSFSIYMVQSIPLQQICDYYYWNHGKRLDRLSTFLIIIGGTLLLAILFYNLVEKPSRKTFNQLLR